MAEQAITQGSIRYLQYSDIKQNFTDSACRSIFEPGGPFTDQPVMQCVQIKTMEPKAGDSNTVQRFRVVLSDIRNFIQTMIATGTSTSYWGALVCAQLILLSGQRHRHVWKIEEGLYSKTAEVQSSAGQG